MQTSTVFLMLIALSVVSFLIGRQRSHLVTAGQGGARALHSLPKHYGYMAALWAGLPALFVLVVWMAMEGRVLNSLVIASLPAEIRSMPESELGLYYNQVVSFARGSIDASMLDANQAAAAERYGELLARSRILKALLVAVDDLLIGIVDHRAGKQVLDQQRIGVGGSGAFNQQVVHGLSSGQKRCI